MINSKAQMTRLLSLALRWCAGLIGRASPALARRAAGLSAAAQQSFALPSDIFVARGRYKGEPPGEPHFKVFRQRLSGGFVCTV